MRANQLLRRRCLIAGLAIASSGLGGCAFRTQTTSMAVEYNEFIAQTTNRQTVLNILRAREREPMHFTSFGEIFGTVREQGAVGVGGAFNGNNQAATTTNTNVTNTGGIAGGTATATRTLLQTVGATNITPNVSVQVNTGTDFKVAANTTDDFYKGILTPISPALVIHYLRQGFPSDLLSHLLISRLEYNALITDPSGKVETFSYELSNHPQDPEDSAAIATAIRCLPLDYAVRQTPATSLPITNIEVLAPISSDVLKRLQATTDDKGVVHYSLVTPAQVDTSLLLTAPPGAPDCNSLRQILVDHLVSTEKGDTLRHAVGTVVSPSSPEMKAMHLQGSALPIRGPNATSAGATDGTSPAAVQFTAHELLQPVIPPPYKVELTIDVTLRSVEGILYYLGEYIRNPNVSPKLLGSCGYCLPIIRVEPVDAVNPAERFVEVTYRGVRYAVPISGGGELNAEAGRSSQTIDLVEQLLNLNRSSKDLPTTPFVHVVAQ